MYVFPLICILKIGAINNAAKLGERNVSDAYKCYKPV